MSVRKGDRTQGKLEVLNLAMNLCTHTLQLCKNEKYFPKSQRWMFTQKITSEAIDALTDIRKANVTLVDGTFLANADRGNTWHIQQNMKQYYAECTGGEFK